MPGYNKTKKLLNNIKISLPLIFLNFDFLLFVLFIINFSIRLSKVVKYSDFS